MSPSGEERSPGLRGVASSGQTRSKLGKPVKNSLPASWPELLFVGPRRVRLAHRVVMHHQHHHRHHRRTRPCVKEGHAQSAAGKSFTCQRCHCGSLVTDSAPSESDDRQSSPWRGLGL
ncbi:hypothetical protein EYF80_026240 [Liparis tanakae]|uniref:Uncharacterized protein n=1 Tax=Liparis tanakae TaxID=230148 RepID=A0A4Z2HCJ6_9TELE|nr:hypothetical protein EYF80_026240 [Liparis tanakae]